MTTVSQDEGVARTTVGLAGFGSAGRGIHAPLLQQAGMTIVAVSTSNPQRGEQVRAEVPGAGVVADLDALLAVPGLDLIVLATPSGLHAGQARQCIDAGVAVVVDKPLATDATQAYEVVDAARAAGVALSVFQNRRFDAEHVAARQTVESGLLGEVFRHEFRWERWRPTPKDRWRENASVTDGGGILLDLQSHLIDAAVDLFGSIDSVYAEIAARTTPAEDETFLACRHTSGVVSHLSALEGQVDFYRQVRRALAGQAPQADMPVDPFDAVHTLAVIDAARASAAVGTVVQVRTPGQR